MSDNDLTTELVRVELGNWSWERNTEPMRAPTGPPVIVMDKTTVKATRCVPMLSIRPY